MSLDGHEAHILIKRLLEETAGRHLVIEAQ